MMIRSKFITFSIITLMCFAKLSGCSKSDAASQQSNVDQEDLDDLELSELAILEANNVTTTGMEIIGKVLDKGGSLVFRRGVCWSLLPDPTIDDTAAEAVSTRGDGTFRVQLAELESDKEYFIRAYAENKGGVAYSEQISVKTASVQSITFVSKQMFIVGSTRAAYDVEIASNGGGVITELGLCWAMSENPTIADNIVVHEDVTATRFRAEIEGLTERTDYFLRPYAINEQGVSYGENVQFKTVGKGKLTYTFNKANNPSAEQLAAYDRLQIAIDSAIWYVENYTSVTKHVYINYDPNVPTADANNEGWMRFGSNSSFQNIRTMLHELNHTFGTGTSSWWWNQAMIGGKYQLSHANNMLKLIVNDEEAIINGDRQHWWPYGLNQNSEVTSAWDYVYNCLIIEAMRRDGMTSHSGAYTP